MTWRITLAPREKTAGIAPTRPGMLPALLSGRRWTLAFSATLAPNRHRDLYRSRVGAIATLDNDHESQLATRWRAGDGRAGRALVESNLKYVIGIAREYRRWGAALDDLIQQGNIGLLKAAERYDPAHQSSLRTYAAYWIRAEIRDYVVRHYRIVRLGSTRTERRAMRAYRRQPIGSVEELVAFSGMPEERCRMLLPLLQANDRSLNHAREGHAPPIDLLPGRTPSPEDLLQRAEEVTQTRLRVREAMDSLSDRERHILTCRLLEDDPQTLEQLGVQLGVSRERVRQLESRAKAKMRDALTS